MRPERHFSVHMLRFAEARWIYGQCARGLRSKRSGFEPWPRDIVFCSCQDTLLSQVPLSTQVYKCSGGGEGLRCDGLASHPGRVDILLVAELWPNGPFTSRAEFASFM